ncbi:neurotrimin-like [Aphis craccivora]|uniref:Neurotrimin-like n=1 Tax=Aphis craccivora TaxID=307492 RepID=A0A6G0YUT4_APHCR|nr:neurotrimin-like [Aphis craccivora]
MEWQPTGKRPRGRPRKRWMDRIRKDLEKLGRWSSGL